jgi:hypothetical protein
MKIKAVQFANAVHLPGLNSIMSLNLENVPHSRAVELHEHPAGVLVRVKGGDDFVVPSSNIVAMRIDATPADARPDPIVLRDAMESLAPARPAPAPRGKRA